MSDTRRGFFKKLGIGIAGAMLAANLDLGYKPVTRLTHGEVLEALTLPPQGVGWRAEPLELTLRSVSFKMEHVEFWRDIKQAPMFNTLDEHHRIASGLPAYRPPLKQRIREFFFSKPKIVLKAFPLDHDRAITCPTPRGRLG